MKQKLYIVILLLVSINLQAQFDEPILSDTMTLSQARYELQREMSTINHYYFQDYYGQRLSDRFKYHKTFRDKKSEFELLPPDTIRQRILADDWSASLHHTNRSEESNFWISHGFDGDRINKARQSTPRYIRSTFVPRIVYYYGSTESDAEILKTDKWYKNRKHIDSISVDLTLHYPTEIATVSISATISGKKDFGNGSFLWLISNDGNYTDVAVTEDIVNNLAGIHGITEDGIRYDHSRNTYTPKQPSTEMFSYASACYTYCRQLIQNIDDGKYRSIKDLIKDFDRTRPAAPAIKWVYRYAFKSRSDLQTIEFKYYTKYDSVSIPNKKAYDFIARKGDYVIVEQSTGNRIIRGMADKDGKWIIKPSTNTGIIEEVAGTFYKIGNTVDHSKESYELAYPDEKKKRFVKTGFEIVRNINDTVLITGQDELFGAMHRNGSTLLPIRYAAVDYPKGWKVFIVRLKSDVPQYQLFHENGEQALSKTYRLIEVSDGRLYTTKIEGDCETVEVYDKNLKQIKDQTVVYTIAKPLVRKVQPEKVLDITERLSLVKEKNLFGVAGKDGNTVIPIIYSTVWYDALTEMITAMTFDRKFLLFRTDGKRALPNEYKMISQKNGLIYVSEIVGGKEVMAVYDKKVKQINPKNTFVESEFNAGLEPVLAKDKDGYQFFMNRAGKPVLPHSNMVQYLDGFHSNRALAMPRRFAPANPVYGYIGLDGNTTIPFRYTKAYSFRGEYAYVEENNKAMFIKVNNEILKELPAKAKNVYLAESLTDTRYWLTNGDVYDGYANLVNRENME